MMIAKYVVYKKQNLKTEINYTTTKKTCGETLEFPFSCKFETKKTISMYIYNHIEILLLLLLRQKMNEYILEIFDNEEKKNLQKLFE